MSKLSIEDQLLKLECLNDALFCIQTGIETGTEVANDKLSNALYILQLETEQTIQQLYEINGKIIKLA